jgi:plasmid stabilization system protein ParE
VKIRRVIILPPAERDIEKAYRWLSQRDAFAAIRWYNRLLDAILSLETFPERCPIAPESKYFTSEIRQLLHGRRQHKYRILFDITDEEVRVLHVRHGARLALGESQPTEE